MLLSRGDTGRDKRRLFPAGLCVISLILCVSGVTVIVCVSSCTSLPCLCIYVGHFSPCAPLTCLVMETMHSSVQHFQDLWLVRTRLLEAQTACCVTVGELQRGCQDGQTSHLWAFWVGRIWCVALLLQLLNLTCLQQEGWEIPTHFHYMWDKNDIYNFFNLFYSTSTPFMTYFMYWLY